MTMPATVKQYLENHHVHYDVLAHRHTLSSLATAHAANVPAGSLAKSVVLQDEDGFVLAVLPANHRLDLGALQRLLGRPLGLATERDAARLFRDCERGAIPPLGEAYGVDVVLDDSLREPPEVYFEAGDHAALIRMGNRDFRELFAACQRGRFSHRVE